MSHEYHVMFSHDIDTEKGMYDFMEYIHHFFTSTKKFSSTWRRICSSQVSVVKRPRLAECELREYSDGVETYVSLDNPTDGVFPGLYKGVMVLALTNPEWTPVNSSQLFGKGPGQCKAIILYKKLAPIRVKKPLPPARNWVEEIQNEFRRVFLV